MRHYRSFICLFCLLLAVAWPATTSAQLVEPESDEEREEIADGLFSRRDRQTIAFSADETVSKGLAGLLRADEFPALLEKYAGDHCRIHLEVAWAGALLGEKRFGEALTLLAELDGKTTAVGQFADMAAGYYRPGSSIFWLGSSQEPEGLWVLHGRHCTRYPNMERDNVELLKARALLGLGNAADARNHLNALIREHDADAYVREDSEGMRTLEGDVHDSMGFSVDDINEMDDSGRVIVPGATPGRFLFRSSVASESLGTPCGIHRPWRDARLARAECLAAQGQYWEAAAEIDCWLSMYGRYYSFEANIEASLSRMLLLQKAGSPVDVAKEAERGLQLCEEFEEYLKKDNVCFKVNPRFHLPAVDPSELVDKIRKYIETMRATFSRTNRNGLPGEANDSRGTPHEESGGSKGFADTQPGPSEAGPKLALSPHRATTQAGAKNPDEGTLSSRVTLQVCFAVGLGALLLLAVFVWIRGRKSCSNIRDA